jgi:hypothetical protein
MNKTAIDLKKLVTEIATFLPGYEIKPVASGSDNPFYAEIKNPEGRGFNFYHNTHKDKLSISPVYPTDSNGTSYPRTGERTESINVNPAKEAKVIARDISSRLMSGYETTFADGLKLLENHNIADGRQLEVWSNLAKIINHKSSNNFQKYDLYLNKNNVYLKGSVGYNGTTVSLERVTLPAEKAERILKILAE